MTLEPFSVIIFQVSVEQLFQYSSPKPHQALILLPVVARVNSGYVHTEYGRQAMLPDACEIGYTWLTQSAIRTAVNTETKLLMLTHAFEAWRVLRVCFHTDVRNQRSRSALERIGARRRTAGPSNGCRPHTARLCTFFDSFYGVGRSEAAPVNADG